MMTDKQKALVYYLTDESENVRDAIRETKISTKDDDYERIDILGYDLTCYDDDEANEAEDRYLDSWIEMAIEEIPENLRFYFDEELYKQDLDKDRGNDLSSFDGEEYCVNVHGTWYYIYRN